MDRSGEVVLVVDDDPSVRNALDRLLRATGFVVETFESAEAFLESDVPEGPVCVLLDVHLPGLDGIETQARMRRSGLGIPVVYLTGRGDIHMGVQAMKAGAVDFLTKPVDDTVLLAAVRTALDRQADEIEHEATRLDVLDHTQRLSAREYEVMLCLLSGARNKVIADHLGIVEQTVKVHRRQVMEKMEVSSFAELVRLCTLAGLAATEIG